MPAGPGADLSLAWAPGAEGGDTVPLKDRKKSLDNKHESIKAPLKSLVGAEETEEQERGPKKKEKSHCCCAFCLQSGACSSASGIKSKRWRQEAVKCTNCC